MESWNYIVCQMLMEKTEDKKTQDSQDWSIGVMPIDYDSGPWF